MVSAWGDVVPGDFVRTLEQAYGGAFGYRVAASLPADYTRDWADGDRSPGDVLLTLLSKNEKLTYDAFMSEWHGRHTPKAMRIHPMWRYARNVVEAKVTPDAPTFEGVVEEHYRTLSDITNPVRMFGGPRRFLPNMGRGGPAREPLPRSVEDRELPAHRVGTCARGTTRSGAWPRLGRARRLRSVACLKRPCRAHAARSRSRSSSRSPCRSAARGAPRARRAHPDARAPRAWVW
jgi:hypothetical protein